MDYTVGYAEHAMGDCKWLAIVSRGVESRGRARGAAVFAVSAYASHLSCGKLLPGFSKVIFEWVDKE
jgi:hypothetical protein